MLESDKTDDGGKKDEQRTFLFICVLLFPALSIALVGSYGLVVWLSHVFAGP